MQNRKSLRIVDIVMVLVIIIVTLFQTSKMKVPSLATDEYGYLGSAAFFAGFDWSKHISKSNGYFSYIYGIIISLWLRFISNSFIVYRCIQILNTLVLIINYFICQKIIAFFDLHVNKFYTKFLAIIMTLYCSNIILAKCVLPECFLAMLFNLSIYFLYKLCKERKWIYCILLSGTALILCSMHQRAISIVVATAIVFILMKLNNNLISNKKICVFLFVIAIGLGLYELGKDYIISQVWLNATITEFQSYGEQIKKFSFLTSVNGWYVFLCSIIGKVFYLLVSTNFMLIYCLKCCCKKIVLSYKQGSYNAVFYLYSFILLSFIFTMGISSLFLNSPKTTTYLFYGRYNEYIIGIYIIIGLCEFINNPSLKFDAVSVIIFITISLLCKNYMIGEKIVDGNCAILTPAITHFYSQENTFGLEICSLVTAAVFIFMILIREIQKGFWIGLTILCINIWSGFCAFDDFFKEDMININNAVAIEAQTIQKIKSGQNNRICVVVTDGKEMSATYVKTVQFVLKDMEIDACSQEEIEQIYTQYDYVIAFDDLWRTQDKMVLVYNEEGVSLYCNEEVGTFEKNN